MNLSKGYTRVICFLFLQLFCILKVFLYLKLFSNTRLKTLKKYFETFQPHKNALVWSGEVQL